MWLPLQLRVVLPSQARHQPQLVHRVLRPQVVCAVVVVDRDDGQPQYGMCGVPGRPPIQGERHASAEDGRDGSGVQPEDSLPVRVDAGKGGANE